MKALIEHILIKLRQALGLPTGNAGGDYEKDRAELIMQGLVNQAEESGDEILLKIPQDRDSSDEEEDKQMDDDHIDLNLTTDGLPNDSKFVSSNHVSTILDPTIS